MVTVWHHEAGECGSYDTVDEAVLETLRMYWEDEREVGFVIRDTQGRTVATLTTIGEPGYCEGTVEEYRPGEPPKQHVVRYRTTTGEEGGAYAGTWIDGVLDTAALL